jgi:hypothetical protein
MCVNSGSCGLKHSHYNPEHNTNAETPHQKSEETTSEQRDRQLEMLKTNFFNLVATRNTEKALKAATVFIKTAEKCVNILKRYVNNTPHNKINNKDIIKIIHTEIKTAV